jgi:hypothetical protein
MKINLKNIFTLKYKHVSNWVIIALLLLTISLDSHEVSHTFASNLISDSVFDIKCFPSSEINTEVSIIFVGDIMLSRGVAGKMRSYKDYNYPFLKARDYLKTGDLVFGNLETSITEGRKIRGGEMVFRADPEVAESLKESGFSILSLANNHSMNFGEDGIKNTLAQEKTKSQLIVRFTLT